MGMYEGYHIWGMHLVWWFVWIIFLFWIFAIPYNIPGQRSTKEKPIDLLKRRFASGQIDKEEFIEKMKLLKDN